MPRISRYLDAAALLQVTQRGMEQHEAENSLMLGILLSIARSDPAAPRAEVLVTVERENRWALAALMTPPHPLVVCATEDASDVEMAALVGYLRREAIVVPGVAASVAVAQRFADQWTKGTGVTAKVRFHQRIHALRAVRVETTCSGSLRLATRADAELVGRWYAGFEAEALGEHDPPAALERARHRIEAGQVYLWDDGGPRSVAAWGRPTRNTISVNAVYTPPSLRGRGFATAVVAELSRQLLAQGYRMCVLYTDVTNPVANSIYRRIGYEPVLDSRHIVFRDDAAEA